MLKFAIRCFPLATVAFFITTLGCSGVSSHPSAQGLNISPSPVAFDAQVPDTTTTQSVSLVNAGSAAVTVTSVSVSGSSAFSMSQFGTPLSLQPGQSTAVVVAFGSATEGTYTGSLVVDASIASVVSVPLSGTVKTLNVGISVAPTSASVVLGATQKFSATITGTTNHAVTWYVNGVLHGNSTYGTISNAGLYTAPSSMPSGNITITAKSVADPAKSASASVTLSQQSQVTVSISPTSAVLQVGLSQQFIASVSGTNNTAVTWLVNNIQGGNSTVGTITTGGLYTAPQTVPSGGVVSVTARSVADSTKSASASVTISGKPGQVTVTVSPTTATLAGGQNQQFTATVTGTSNHSVNWYVAGVLGGNSTNGTITTSGLYTAPGCPSQTTTTITATSVYDGTASANANVALSGEAPAGSGGNYYVATTGSDSNTGAGCHPWATVNHANAVVKAGAIVHLAPGTYNQSPRTTVGGTSSAPIRYVSDTKWGAKIVGSSDPVWQNSGAYVNIEGFDITAATSSVTIGVWNFGNHSRVLYNKVHDIVASGAGGNGGAGIDLANNGTCSDYAEASGNLVYNIGWPNGDNHIQGIYLQCQYQLVSNNLIYHVSGWGIHLYHSPVGHATLVNNTIFNSGGGIEVGSNGTGASATDYNYVANNIAVYSTVQYGIGECCDATNVGTHNTYTNNLVYQNKATDFHFWTGSDVNSVVADPLFVNYKSDGTGDYHLQSASPAVDAGTSTGGPQPLPLFDYDSIARPQGSGYDIGAFEWH